MSMSVVSPENAIGEAGLRRLRHDLLNALNILMGSTSLLLETELNDVQRSCVAACRNSGDRLMEIAQQLEQYRETAAYEQGPAQLADLCSIAVARIDKPFGRDELLSVIRRLAPKPAPRILLVDDAPDIAVLVKTYLKDTNSIVDVVADGERAVAQASSQQYDVVLMDINLPGLDGATAAHAIRTADLARNVKPTPIVALSAVGSQVSSQARPPAESDDVVVLEDPETAPLVPEFLQHRRNEVPEMRALLEGAEFERIKDIGHRMKGSGRGYGFERVSRFGEDIERAAHQHDAETIDRLLSELDNYLARVTVVPR